MQTIPFSSYSMKNPVAYFLGCLYVVHGKILGEEIYDAVQS